MIFPSLANPSGKGNRRLASGIESQLKQGAYLIINNDVYVALIQPDKTAGMKTLAGGDRVNG
ncbi:MAG: hypothetical protein P8M25_05275 [Paracoccaceae bacterium]|nr:hypothetical protein [Paracoccaceae bacterium]